MDPGPPQAIGSRPTGGSATSRRRPGRSRRPRRRDRQARLSGRGGGVRARGVAGPGASPLAGLARRAAGPRRGRGIVVPDADQLDGGFCWPGSADVRRAAGRSGGSGVPAAAPAVGEGERSRSPVAAVTVPFTLWAPRCAPNGTWIEVRPSSRGSARRATGWLSKAKSTSPPEQSGVAASAWNVAPNVALAVDRAGREPQRPPAPAPRRPGPRRTCSTRARPCPVRAPRPPACAPCSRRPKRAACPPHPGSRIHSPRSSSSLRRSDRGLPGRLPPLAASGHRPLGCGSDLVSPTAVRAVRLAASAARTSAPGPVAEQPAGHTPPTTPPRWPSQDTPFWPGSAEVSRYANDRP